MHAQFVINEIMFAPKTPEPEWVELVNTDSAAHNLSGLYFHDSGSRVALQQYSVAAGHYVVLCKDTAALVQIRPHLPSSSLCKVSLPSLNNSGEYLALRLSDSTVVDSLRYTNKGVPSGYSVERVNAWLGAENGDNLRACTYAEGASCGELNSVSLTGRDVAAESWFIDTLAQSLELVVSNLSRSETDGTSWSFRSQDVEWFGGIIEKLGITSHDTIHLSLDSIRAKAQQTLIQCLFICHATGDERQRNDTLALSLRISPVAQAIRINEILYDPTSTQSEFVELYNATDMPLDLSELQLHDGSGGYLLVPDSCSISARDYLVLCKDTTLRFEQGLDRNRIIVCKDQNSWTLRSTDELVSLRDPYGRILDSVRYSSSWHSSAATATKGRSLEKVSPDLPSAVPWSWTTCVDSSGCTPGAINSVARAISSVADIQCNPNPFSARSPLGAKQSTYISIHLPAHQCRVLLRLFDASGRMVREFYHGEYSGSDLGYLWDGRDDAGFDLPLGVYIVHVEAVDVQTQDTIQQSAIVVIGE